MAAISTTILAYVHAGEEVVSTPALYGGTYRFFRDTLPGSGIAVHYVNPKDLSSLDKRITKKTRLVYFETPTNPTLDLVDIGSIVAHVKKAEKKYRTQILTMIDNTFASCLNQKPFDAGVDIVMEKAPQNIWGDTATFSRALL